MFNSSITAVVAPFAVRCRLALLIAGCVLGWIGCEQSPPAAPQPAAGTAAPSSTGSNGKVAPTPEKAPDSDAADDSSRTVEDDSSDTSSGVSTASDDDSMPDGDEPVTDDDGLKHLRDAVDADNTELPDEAAAQPFVPESYVLGEETLLVDPEGLVRLDPDSNVWVDKEHKRVVMAGEICRRDAVLEMFACLKGTKEHESVVSVHTKAMFVHAALLAVGATPGHPVQFQPEYVAAEGPEIDVTVLWKDDEGERHEARAQDWVRSRTTGEALDAPFVFGGSGFWKNEKTGDEYYLAESGDFICVSNFPSAMLDLPIESSAQKDSELFEPFTERIPAEKTKVTLILAPKIKAED